MLTCATVPPVAIKPDDPETAHRMTGEMATETLMDLVASARALEAAIIMDRSAEEQRTIREQAIAQAEAYLDLTAEAATLVRALKP